MIKLTSFAIVAFWTWASCQMEDGKFMDCWLNRFDSYCNNNDQRIKFNQYLAQFSGKKKDEKPSISMYDIEATYRENTSTLFVTFYIIRANDTNKLSQDDFATNDLKIFFSVFNLTGIGSVSCYKEGGRKFLTNKMIKNVIYSIGGSVTTQSKFWVYKPTEKTTKNRGITLGFKEEVKLKELGEKGYFKLETIIPTE